MSIAASSGKIVLIAAIVTLLASSASQATLINGSLSFFPLGSGTYTGPNIQNSTSISMSVPEYIGTGLGDFSGYSFPDTLTMATLPTFPATGTLVTNPDVVSDLIQFTTNGSPVNRFQFDLSTLGEVFSGGLLTVYGSGTLRDTLGSFSPTPAQFTGNGFNDLGSGNFNSSSFTFAASPEPASLGLIAIGAGTLLIRRRQCRD